METLPNFDPIDLLNQGDRRLAQSYSDLIASIAFRECNALDALWVASHPDGKYWQRRRAHRLFLAEFFSFYTCVTERWILQHEMVRREDFLIAMLDGVREKHLRDPWRPQMTSERRAISDSSLMEKHDRAISIMRNNYRHVRNGPGGSDMIVETAAIVLVKYFFTESTRTTEISRILSLLIERLRLTWRELVEAEPYAELRARNTYIDSPRRLLHPHDGERSMLFKKKRNESEAIGAFLRDTASHVSERWEWAAAEIGAGIPNSLAACPDLLEQRATQLTVLMATCGVGLQAVRNILPPDHAQSICDGTCAVVEAVYANEQPALLLAAIDRDWNQALTEHRNPMQSLGALMFNTLDLDDTLGDGGQQIINPVATLSLGSVPVRLACGSDGSAWWKTCLGTFRLVA